MGAKKHVKYALSALDYDDAKTAIEEMRRAIAILEAREAAAAAAAAGGEGGWVHVNNGGK